MFESNDTFIEEAVRRYMTPSEKTIKTGATGGMVVSLLLMFITVFPLVFAALFIVCLVLVIVYGRKAGLDFEYDYTNGSLDIAKIVNNSKRKELLSVEAANIKTIVPADSNQALGLEHQQLKVIDASSHNDEDKTYVMVFHSDKKGCDYKVLWNPSEKLLKAIMRTNKCVTL